jgi:hypothetical protein
MAKSFLWIITALNNSKVTSECKTGEGKILNAKPRMDAIFIGNQMVAKTGSLDWKYGHQRSKTRSNVEKLDGAMSKSQYTAELEKSMITLPMPGSSTAEEDIIPNKSLVRVAH